MRPREEEEAAEEESEALGLFRGLLHEEEQSLESYEDGPIDGYDY